MPSGRKPVAKPAEFLAEGADWPDGPLTEDAPPEVHLAAAVAKRLAAIATARGLSHKRIADDAGIARSTVADMAKGKCWPDMRTIARVECALGAQLWKNEHRKLMPPRKKQPLLPVPRAPDPEPGQ